MALKTSGAEPSAPPGHFPVFSPVLPCGWGWCWELCTLLCPVLLCQRGTREQSQSAPGEVVTVGLPCCSASPPSRGMRVGDAAGLADHALPLAARQNQPREATDLIPCPRLSPHQAPAQVLWNLLPVSRKEKERKSPSERNLVASSCQMEKPWLNLALSWWPHSSLEMHQAGRTHTHPSRTGTSALGLLFPAPLPPGCFGGCRGSRDSLPHRSHTTGTPLHSHLAPSHGKFPGIPPAHRPHLGSSPGIAMPMGRDAGERHPGSSLATQLSHRLCLLPSLLAPSGILLPLYFNPVFWEFIDLEGEVKDRDTCTH